MPKFSKMSKKRLETCDLRVQKIFREVIKRYNCTIICGHRGPKKQAEAYRTGHSKLQYPNSTHNVYPSVAIDVAPYPLNWDDLGGFYMFAGYVIRVAEELGYIVRYGGDWDGDRSTADNKFKDLAHFELIT